MSLALDFLLLSTGWTHVLLAPYTKVEESFNLHAIHDALMYGVGPTTLYNYDHFIFPGAVPRTFLGSIFLAWLSTPVIRAASSLGFVSDKFDLQIIVRLVLATLNASALCLVRRAVSRRFGRPTGVFFVLLTCSQFHIPFWMGRTLPNMFALYPVNISTYLILDRAPNALRPFNRNINTAIALLTFTAVVLRAEVVLLLGPLILQSLILRHVSFTNALNTVVVSGLISLAMTVTVDSYFWDKWPLWPEFSGIYFNVYQGKSSEWGISPPHSYVTSHLPKLLLSSLPLSIIGAVLDSRVRTMLLPSVAFITLISFLGHKEWRFIVYVVPLFNVAAARGARWMASRRKGGFFGRILFLGVSGLLLCNILATTLVTKASMANYPGGTALSLMNFKYANAENVHVHIANLAAQTGASLFLQIHSKPYPPQSLLGDGAVPPERSVDWVYNKTESLSYQTLTNAKSITHLISESRPPSNFIGGSDWKVVESVHGFQRWVIDWDLVNGRRWKNEGIIERIRNLVTMGEEDKLWILERKSG